MYTTQQKSLITSILSAGTFVGALSAGYFCDKFGRRFTIVAGGSIYMAGVAMQTAAQSVDLLVAGRAIAGLGVGIVNSAVVLYTSEITAKKTRGKVMSCYQWAITIGLLISAGVNQGTKDLHSSAAYRIPIGLQFAWALILVLGVLFMPESPRWYVMKERPEEARNALCRLRSQEPHSGPITRILKDLKDNYNHEVTLGAGSGSWADCFRGGWKCGSNLQLSLLGIGTQAMQQLSKHLPSLVILHF
jgi:MFS family permease